MLTELDIDDALLEEAVRVGNHPSQDHAVNTALREYVQRRRQAAIIKLFGAVDFDPEYDWKRSRS